MENKKPEHPTEQQSGEGRPKRRRRNHRSAAAKNHTQQTEHATEVRTEPRTQSGNSRREGNGKDDHRADNSGNRPERAQKRRDGNRGGAKWGLVDPYGKPTEEDSLSLEELRARIVLKAADGSVPEKPSTPPERPHPDACPVSALSQARETENPISDLYPMPTDPIEAEPNAERIEVVGIRFRSSGKVYYFDPKGISLHAGESAIVETVRGPEFGEVSFGNRMIPLAGAVTPLRPVLRAATNDDIARNEENRAKEQEAFRFCQERVTARKLDMKLIDAQYAFDNSKLLIYFSAENRVDFRELVKDLAAAFRTRIELRQIGIRDEAKMLGGLGACGRPLCCSTFLNDFGQVSIKMAKEQNLSLNSLKISGICGRLMCCLRYEADTYAAEAKLTPPVHATVKTADGIGTVVSSVPLAGTVKVVLQDSPDSAAKTYHRDEVVLLSKKDRTPAETPENGTSSRKRPTSDRKNK